MSRKTTAVIHLAAIKHNYLYAKSRVPHAKAIAIVKANAYGHGAKEVASSLDSTVDAFGVACIEEAIALRQANIKSDILLLEGIFEESELAVAAANNFMLVVAGQHQLHWLSDYQGDHRFDVFLKLDSGMGRLGFLAEAIDAAFDRLRALKCVKQIILMSHFCCADELHSSVTQKQLAQVEEIQARFSQSQKVAVSISNSAGILAQLYPQQDFIRPGIMLYGAAPMSCDNDLKNTMTLTAPIISLKTYQQGDSIGYGATYICENQRLIAVVAIGYADGYPRHAKTGTHVYVNNTIAPLVGRVSMDMITIDVTNVPKVKLGDDVELFGGHVAINDLADDAQTISYEIFTKMTARVYRQYQDN